MATTKKSTPESTVKTSSATVLVEGSVMPAAGVLGRGEQAFVQLTETINTLVEGGFLVIKDDSEQAPTTSGVNQDLLQVAPPTDPGNQDLLPASPPEQIEPPATDPTDPKPEPTLDPGVDNGLVNVNAK